MQILMLYPYRFYAQDLKNLHSLLLCQEDDIKVSPLSVYYHKVWEYFV